VWDIQCVCGKVIQLAINEFCKMRQKSCGCKRYEMIGDAQRTHGMSHHPAFAVWRSMVDRCKLPTHHARHNYGARGIKVCDRWQESFENFWVDMGPTYAAGLTLDRLDNNGDYTPENCRWVTMKVQGNNKRTNRIITSPDGRALTVSQLAEELGIRYSTLINRLDRGWPWERLSEKPSFARRTCSISQTVAPDTASPS
jgi:hypothetical protein